MGARLAGVLLLLAACLGACQREAAHGAEPDAAEPLAVTRWSDRHELFIEFPAPAPGKPVSFHAHVTELGGFRAVEAGRLRVRFESAGSIAAEASAAQVVRPGIFAVELTAPAAGRYELEVVYEAGGNPDVFEGGSVEVGAGAVPAAAPGAGIEFAKEQQWKIPFATALAKKHPIRRELEVPATVEPAGGQQLTVGAPTAGRFFHNPKLELAEGRNVAKGDVIGFVAPSVAGEDYGRLQLSLDEARIDKERAERELARIQPLVDQGLLPERRLLDLRAELEAAGARLASAKTRIGRVLAPAGAGGLPIKSALAGVVSRVLVPNGEPVESGAPLVRIGGTDHVWIRARFVARPPSELEGARASAVRLADGRRFELDPAHARLLSSQPAVDAASRLATWIADVAPAASSSSNLTVGASVVLELAIGAPRTVLAVPRSALVEINTRPFVFVQTGGESFEKRAVRAGGASGGLVEIEQGVTEHERVVTLGGFDVHLASLMGNVESHRH